MIKVLTMKVLKYNSLDSQMEIMPVNEINHNAKKTYLLLLKDGRLVASYNSCNTKTMIIVMRFMIII